DVRQRGGTFNGALRRRASKLYGEQEEVKDLCDKAVEALNEGNNGGFTRNMEIIQRLLLSIMGSLEGRNPDVGEGTQVEQAEVIEKIDRMIGAVEGERKRLRENRGNEGQPNNNQGQPAPEPLVSKLAEMELVYEEQKALDGKIRNLAELAREYDRDSLPDYYKRLFERYASEQAALKQIWEDLRKQVPKPPAAPTPREEGDEGESGESQ
ncbi:MAG: hypothetical protein OEY28_13860, partial [Nitrospira sp.]|nr:hypothetical protein [Nitrospira sp.]